MQRVDNDVVDVVNRVEDPSVIKNPNPMINEHCNVACEVPIVIDTGFQVRCGVFMISPFGNGDRLVVSDNADDKSLCGVRVEGARVCDPWVITTLSPYAGPLERRGDVLVDIIDTVVL